MVASFCNLDAGCLWRHAFHTVPVAEMAVRYLHLPFEGLVRARVAVVRGRKVGPWSGPSAPIAIDHTPPSIPGGLAAVPSAARAGPFVLNWGAVVDTFTGFDGVVIEGTELSSGNRRQFRAPPRTTANVSPITEGRYELRVASFDRVNNQSDWSIAVIILLDSTGPLASRPTSVAAAIDGGAMVTINWSLPADALSQVASEDLLELSVLDGGRQLVRVTGLAVSRVVPPGSWRWALRGTDSLGNVGDWSEVSTPIVVTPNGIGPVIGTTSVPARCGEPLAVDLVGTGSAPLSWTLLDGPLGAALTPGGQLTWTPPAENAVVQHLQVKLRNAVTDVVATINVDVSCASSSDGGNSGGTDGGARTPRFLVVGCGCSSGEALLGVLAVLGLLVPLRRSQG